MANRKSNRIISTEKLIATLASSSLILNGVLQGRDATDNVEFLIASLSIIGGSIGLIATHFLTN